MNYELMDMTEADMDKVTKDSAQTDRLSAFLIRERGRQFSLPKRWAVNVDGSSYLLIHYSERDLGSHYIFFLNGAAYEIWIEPGMFESKRSLKFIGPRPARESINEVIYFLTQAFVVHGDLGFGEQNGVGAVVPVYADGE